MGNLYGKRSSGHCSGDLPTVNMMMAGRRLSLLERRMSKLFFLGGGGGGGTQEITPPCFILLPRNIVVGDKHRVFVRKHKIIIYKKCGVLSFFFSILRKYYEYCTAVFFVVVRLLFLLHLDSTACFFFCYFRA